MAVARLVALLFVALFLASPFILLAVALLEGRKQWARFGDALRDTREPLP